MSRWIPKKYRPATVVAIIVHVFFFALIAWSATFEEKVVLGAGDGRTIVHISVMEPAPKPAPEPKKIDPKPEKKEPEKKPEKIKEKPVEKKPEPKPQPKPKPTPKPQPKPQPTPAPRKTPEPKPVKKEEPKPVVKPPKEVKREEKKEEKKSTVLTPEKARELRGVPTPQSRSARPVRTPAAPARRPDTSSNASASRASSESRTEVKQGGTTLKGLGLPPYYAQAALDKLARFFQIPDAKQRDVTAVLSCRISRNGMISNIRVVRSSGSSDLNDLAIQALERTQRFNPFPDNFPKSHVDVEITFTFTR